MPSVFLFLSERNCQFPWHRNCRRLKHGASDPPNGGSTHTLHSTIPCPCRMGSVMVVFSRSMVLPSFCVWVGDVLVEVQSACCYLVDLLCVQFLFPIPHADWEFWWTWKETCTCAHYRVYRFTKSTISELVSNQATWVFH